MASKYRLESLEIEGFKAFANKQEIKFDSKPTFIFGENGKGKSSIIEAIVWCLYGTDKAVRNRLYDGVCSVALYLVEKSKPEDRWRVYRRMHQADNESDVDVYSPRGEKMNITDFIPQLRKLEHGPGTRVIFAEQEPGRRYSHDFSKFEEMIAAYLGLDVIYSLIDRLEDLIQTQESEFDSKVRSTVQAVGNRITQKMQKLSEQTSSILEDPPWNTELPPSETDIASQLTSIYTELKEFQQDYDDKCPKESSHLLERCNSALERAKSSTREEKEKRKREIEAKVKQVDASNESLKQEQKKLDECNSELERSRTSILNILIDRTIESLQAELQQIEQENQKLVQETSLLTAAKFLAGSQSESCPLCDSNFEPSDLFEVIGRKETDLSQQSPYIAERMREIKDILPKAESLQARINDLPSEISECEGKIKQLKAEIVERLEITEFSEDAFNKKRSELKGLVSELTDSISNDSNKFQNIANQLFALRKSVEYYGLLKVQAKIEAILESDDYLRTMSKIREFDNLILSMKEIKAALDSSYVKVFSSHLDWINNKMTEVYQSLTKQKSFDSVRIIQEPGNTVDKTRRKMILQVGSAIKDVWVMPEKEDVLNGQSLSALNLVPYFTFAEMGTSMHEIDFLLVDDPSQSFDTSHFEYLLGLLDSVSDTSQVIVATHEKGNVLKSLPRDTTQYKLLEVQEFDVESGPKLAELSLKDVDKA